MAEFDFENIIAQIRELEKERAYLLTQPLSPEDAWIHHYTKKRTYPSGFTGWYQYAKYQADEPIFERKPKQYNKRMREKEAGINQNPVKDQHIGRMWSSTGLGCDDEVIEAYADWYRRKRLEAIDKALARIMKALEIAAKIEPVEIPLPPEVPDDLNDDI